MKKATLAASQTAFTNLVLGTAPKNADLILRSTQYALQGNKLHHIFDKAGRGLSQLGPPELLVPRIIDALLRSGKLPSAGNTFTKEIAIVIDGVTVMVRGFVASDGTIKIGIMFPG